MKDFTATTNPDDVIYEVSSIKTIADKNKSITITNEDIEKDKANAMNKTDEKESSLSSFSGGCGCLMISFALVFLFAYEAVFNFIIRLISIIKA